MRGPSTSLAIGLDRLEVVRRGDGEAGLDDVDAQLGELAGDLELLGAVQGGARRLFAVAQRGVEDVDVAVLGHDVPTPPKAEVVATCVVADGSGCDPERGRYGRQVSTHPPAGGGAGRGRGGRARWRVPQCGPPGATRLCCGDASSGESTSGVREGASRAQNQDNTTPVSVRRRRGTLEQYHVTMKVTLMTKVATRLSMAPAVTTLPAEDLQAGAFVLRRDARPRDRDARRHAGGPLRPRRQGQPDLPLRARPQRRPTTPRSRSRSTTSRGPSPSSARAASSSRTTTSPASRRSTDRRAGRRQGRLVQGQRGQHPLRPRDARAPRQARIRRRREGSRGGGCVPEPAVPRLAADECCPLRISSSRHLSRRPRVTPLVG